MFIYHQGAVVNTSYPNWVMYIAYSMILAGVLPMPLVYLLRRFQILNIDLDIHQGSIRRNETTASTKEMIDEDDVSRLWLLFILLDLHLDYTHTHKTYISIQRHYQTQNHKNLHKCENH